MGLSATLPNYLDVADFLGYAFLRNVIHLILTINFFLSVNRQSGMFYFDSSFRPVPLEQHFIGVRGKLGSPQFRRNLERVTFEKVADLVKEGHQVMVFVHSRKDTVHTAQGLKEAALAEGCLEDFSCEEHPTYSFFRSELARSRNKEMKELFEYGFGIHHAGMLRSDRNMMERMFEAKAIKVSQICVPFKTFVIVFRSSAVPQHWHAVSTYPLMQVIYRQNATYQSLKHHFSYHQRHPGV